jgi:renalase
VIIGAGIAGVAAANVCRQRGAAFEMLEKSSGAFGRIATRAHASDLFNYGAYNFDVVSAEWVAYLQAAGIEVSALRAAMQPTGLGLRQLLAPLLEGLPIRYSQQVAALCFPSQFGMSSATLSIALAGGKLMQAAAVVVAIPAPQAAQLIVECKEMASIHQTLAAMLYEPSCVVTACIDESRAAARVLGEGWLARGAAEVRAHGAPAALRQWELRADRAEQLRHWSDVEVARDLLPLAGAAESLAFLHVQHWRYARSVYASVDIAGSRPSFLLGSKLCFVGDWAHGTVASAHESGANGARALLAQLGYT